MTAKRTAKPATTDTANDQTTAATIDTTKADALARLKAARSSASTDRLNEVIDAVLVLHGEAAETASES